MSELEADAEEDSFILHGYMRKRHQFTVVDYKKAQTFNSSTVAPINEEEDEDEELPPPLLGSQRSVEAMHK